MKTTEEMSTLAQKETQEQINGLVLAFREEIMAELQMASDFMSQLQARVETLSKSFKKKQEEDREQELDVRTKMKQLFEKHEELSSKLENLLGQKDSLGEHDEGGEDDLRQQYGIYPGHTHFVPVDKFCLQYLPDGHRDKGLNDMMKALADLTVSVSVIRTSPHRPRFEPNTKVSYYLYNMRGSTNLRTGSGLVQQVTMITDKLCPCHECQHSDEPKDRYWKVVIITAANVVFDNTEAFHTRCKFFYDTENSPDIVLKVQGNSFNKNMNFDFSSFSCFTCDETLGNKLEERWHLYLRLKMIVNKKYIKNASKKKIKCNSFNNKCNFIN
ncbi:uncharacterized protein LOC106076935 isoform X2 [Biomphalaria glabrata]|uniref:Uncharacterized protein LOC106076935 isoform X2 n=1 Tax=Biomphalaria glabrata TaxID=6526 RepID=A0A9W3BBY8_BIOGL|nr:uncharacterized protein LOC106076935 isoform X2 [Biomphalaria glabrata]